MVCLLHVSLFVSNGNFGNTFYVLLFGALIHPIFAAPKALEGQTALEYTGYIFIKKGVKRIMLNDLLLCVAS